MGEKAVLFYYEKGAELWAADGEQPEMSPALRIAFPPYHFIYGSDPTCEELDNVPACEACRLGPGCMNASEAANPEHRGAEHGDEPHASLGGWAEVARRSNLDAEGGGSQGLGGRSVRCAYAHQSA